ncbi:MAG: glycosyltransferase family 1 protein [Candidatus Methanomethylicota archaeon]|uniref:Glycosyltransferase family 1 protein n=1 Tax=Thermoproteota archaeon TaxID=2056631 RepID=A0A497EZK7_9CREN|nr:MAG: glycosyltransferase family 1 protein [Candidatus Verstraetearchaeota archaeon]RLE52833.1 MAG: glycosyltransferase family 1 protein [Candidatus Verstraetearchaeota archaeon]
MKVSINSQTPPVKFNLDYSGLLEKYGVLEVPVDLNALDKTDYQLSVGGVPRMLLQLIDKSDFELVRWVALGPKYPPIVKLKDNLMVYFVSLDAATISGYVKFKEGVYNEAHGLAKYNIKPREYLSYADYNWHCAQRLLKFLDDTDVYFINDFQQLLVGGIIGPSAPAVFWYHIPFVPEMMSPRMRDFIVKSMEAYDVVIVSTKSCLEGLIRAGFRGIAKQIYPFIDPDALNKVGNIQEVKDKFNIRDDDSVALLVGRLDPMKRQDVAIKAIAKVEDVKLVLAGNGSFTSSKGGLATDKASAWYRKLVKLVKELNIEDRVIFTGYVSEEELGALYSIADVVLLTSSIEGFGLTTCEAWVFKKPVVVSRGCGSAELVIDGTNGYTFTPNDYDDLAEKVKMVLSDSEKAVHMGEVGFETAKRCFVDSVSKELKAVFESVLHKK